MIFHLVISFMLSYDIPGWRKCLSTSRAPNVVVKNVLAAPPGQGCQVGRFWEGLYMFKAEDLEVEDLIGFDVFKNVFKNPFTDFFTCFEVASQSFTCWSRPNDLIDSSDVHHCIHRIHLNVLCCVIPGRWISRCPISMRRPWWNFKHLTFARSESLARWKIPGFSYFFSCDTI